MTDIIAIAVVGCVSVVKSNRGSVVKSERGSVVGGRVLRF